MMSIQSSTNCPARLPDIQQAGGDSQTRVHSLAFQSGTKDNSTMGVRQSLEQLTNRRPDNHIGIHKQDICGRTRH